jgi:CHAT domain-containing protein/tetratricopeptide (TPR) repeat protein
VLGLIADRIGERAEAKERFTQAIEAFELQKNLRGRALATLGLLRVGGVAPDDVEALYQRTVDDAVAIDDVSLEGRTLHSLGDRLFSAGKYEAALGQLERAASALDRAGDRAGLGTVYNSLGRLYRAHGRLDTALSYQLKALSVHEKAASPFNHLQSLNAVAVTYQAMGDLQHARVYFDRALELAEGSTSARIQDLLRANLASTLNEQGEYARAANVLEGVLNRGLDAYPAQRYSDLAAAYLKLGRTDEALSTITKAIELCGKQAGRECPGALNQRAEIHTALGDDRAALADVRAALDMLETVRARLVPADFFKQQFNHAQEGVYSHAIALELARGDARSALETAELARSRAFIDLLGSRDIRIEQPAAGVRSLPLTMRGRSAAGPRANARELPSLTTARPARAADLVATAARLHSTLLVYWVASDRTFIWVVKANGEIHSASANVRESKLATLVRATAPFSEEPEPSRPSAPARQVADRGAASVSFPAKPPIVWRQLYDLLVRPVRAHLPRTPGALITIVPHGPLGALAFAALQNERGRYLLEDYTPHYVPAGAVLQFTAPKRHADARGTGRVLLVADPVVPSSRSRLDQPLARLPGARKEIQAIAQFLPKARVTMIQDAAATETRIRSAAPGKAVLHFATHAIVRDDEPLQSYLALGSGENDQGSADGVLSAEEIYNLELDADLVVLSACRSASGRVTGDGIATFARAFIYAGTPALVASLWDVADEPTNRLLPDFYRAWLGGASKARALRAAQLRLLLDLRANLVRIDTPAGIVAIPEHPVFWAGFALIGEPR